MLVLRLPWLALALWLGCSPSAGFAQRGTAASPVLRPLEAAGTKPYRKRFALVVGIDEYGPEVQRLKYAGSDAKAIHDLLAKDLGFDRVHLLLDRDATRRNILAAIVDLKDEMQYEDQFLFFFSGHGVSVGTAAQKIGFFIPQDTDGLDERSVAADAISMADLKERIMKVPAKHVLLIVDACFGGYSILTSKTIHPTTEQYIERITRNKARQIITAGTSNQQVYESDEWKHSAFTFNLLRGFRERAADSNKDGIVIATELFSYLSPTVAATTKGAQTPQYGELSPGEGEFVFFLPSDITLRLPIREAEDFCLVGGAPNIEKGVQMFRDIIDKTGSGGGAHLDALLLRRAEAEYSAGSLEAACKLYARLLRHKGAGDAPGTLR